MVDDQQLIRQNELKEYFSNVYDDTSVAKATDNYMFRCLETMASTRT